MPSCYYIFVVIIAIMCADKPLIFIRDIIQETANLLLNYDKKFYRKWYAIACYMIQILEVITKQLTTESGELDLMDKEINIVSIVKQKVGAENMTKLHQKFTSTPLKEINYVSVVLILLYNIDFLIIYNVAAKESSQVQNQWVL